MNTVNVEFLTCRFTPQRTACCVSIYTPEYTQSMSYQEQQPTVISRKRQLSDKYARNAFVNYQGVLEIAVPSNTQNPCTPAQGSTTHRKHPFLYRGGRYNSYVPRLSQTITGQAVNQQTSSTTSTLRLEIHETSLCNYSSTTVVHVPPPSSHKKHNLPLCFQPRSCSSGTYLRQRQS